MPLISEPEPQDEVDAPVFLGADAIRPRPANQKTFLAYAVILGIAFGGTGVGTGIALQRSDDNRRAIEQKSVLRDAQINAQQAQIEALTAKLKEQHDREHLAVCTALAAAKPSDVVLKLAMDYGCVTP